MLLPQPIAIREILHPSDFLPSVQIPTPIFQNVDRQFCRSAVIVSSVDVFETSFTERFNSFLSSSILVAEITNVSFSFFQTSDNFSHVSHFALLSLNILELAHVVFRISDIHRR